MKTADVVYVGIDISKETLDMDAGELGARKIANSPLEVRKTLAAIAQRTQADKMLQVCFESAGPYTGALIAQCQAAGLRYSILNPYKVKCFAKSLAQAKTDAIDARIIRLYSQVKRPAPTPAPRKVLAELDTLVLAREAVMKSVVALRSTLETLQGAATKPLRRIIAFNEKKIAEYDRLIAEAVETDAEVSGLVGALSEVKGVGTLTAVKVVSGMPEIGRLGRRKAAALVGLAPHTRESGKWKGKARIGGGRKQVRTALFMPATTAIRYNPEMKRIHAHLMAKGKPYKVALTAVMRRLICHLDSVAKDYYAKRKEITA